MVGLVSRVIWVWPSWDRNYVEQKRSYEVHEMELGWFWEASDDSKEPHFCQCELLTEGGSPKRCFFLNSTAGLLDREIEMDVEACHIERTYTSEHINEHHVVDKVVSEEGWIDADSSIILDVDEDFFGCESVSQALVGEDMAWTAVEEIDSKLQSFICPKHAGHEDLGDRFLREVVRSLVDHCRWSARNRSCRIPFNDAVDDTHKLVLSEFIRRPSLFCGENDHQIRSAWREVAAAFYKLPPRQTERILGIGFCLSLSMKTLFYGDGRGGFVICHGLNEPNSSVISYYTPSEEEQQSRMDNFAEVVRTLSKPAPGMATVCRSVRDGYTPRALARQIETHIVKTVQRLNDGKLFTTYYDDELLGSIDGWDGRMRGYATDTPQ